MPLAPETGFWSDHWMASSSNPGSTMQSAMRSVWHATKYLQGGDLPLTELTMKWSAPRIIRNLYHLSMERYCVHGRNGCLLLETPTSDATMVSFMGVYSKHSESVTLNSKVCLWPRCYLKSPWLVCALASCFLPSMQFPRSSFYCVCTALPVPYPPQNLAIRSGQELVLY